MSIIGNIQKRYSWFIFFLIIIGFILFLYQQTPSFFSLASIGWSKPALVKITVTPEDAEIKLGFQYRGVGKLKSYVQHGGYLLVISRPGFKTYARQIKIEPGQKLNKEISLEPLILNFSFDSQPAGANYILTLPNGLKRKGKTPFKGEIKAGRLSIKISREGYNDLEQELFLDSHQEKLYYLDPEGQLVHHLYNIEGVSAPKSIAFTEDGGEIWTTLLLNKKRGVAVFDSANGKKIADINLKGGGGTELTIAEKAYVSQMETAKVFEIDTATRKVRRSFDTESSWTKVLELSEDTKTLYASNWSGDEVSVINLETGRVDRKIPTVDTPRGLYLSSSQKTLYVAGFSKGEIQKVDLETGQSEVIFESGGSMRHLVADEQNQVVYASDMAKGVIWKINLKNDKVKKFTETDANPNTIVLSPDNKILFVSCRGANHPSGNYYIPGPEWGSVLLFDTQTGNMLDAIVAGNQPTGLDVSPDGKILVFSNFLDRNLEVFKVPSYKILKQGGGGRSKVYKKELEK